MHSMCCFCDRVSYVLEFLSKMLRVQNNALFPSYDMQCLSHYISKKLSGEMNSLRYHPARFDHIPLVDLFKSLF